MNKIDLAYIAGLVDGEAYIGIKKDGSLQNGRVNPGYHERIQIRMVNEEAIKFIADNLGGNYYKEKPSAENGRPLFCYQASDKLAANILTILLPYLRIKKEVAKYVLELRERKDNPDTIIVQVEQKSRWGTMMKSGRSRHSPEEVEARKLLYQRCKEINKVGI